MALIGRKRRMKYFKGKHNRNNSFYSPNNSYCCTNYNQLNYSIEQTMHDHKLHNMAMITH